MRITQKYTDRTYLKYNNKLLDNHVKSLEKIARQKAYKRASEDSINASKAMIVRRNLRDLDTYDSNLKTADGIFKAAESNLYTLTSSVYNNVQTKLETACNSTYDKDVDLHIIATEIYEYADSALNVLNKDYAERTMFGGTNNSQPPFTKEKDDVTNQYIIKYNGVRLNDMISDTQYKVRTDKAAYDAAGGNAATNTTVTREAYDDIYATEITKAQYDDISDSTSANYDPDSVFVKTNKVSITQSEYDTLLAADPASVEKNSDGECFRIDKTYFQRNYSYFEATPKDVPGTKPIYVDIGIGIKYNKEYDVEPQTALDVGLNGAAITGYGTSKDDQGVTYSKNFIQQIFDSAAALERGDVPFANATLDRLNKANIGILTEITTLGAKQNSIEFYLDKNEDYRTSLKSRQNDVEGCNIEEEITNLNANQAAYDAILQLSSRVLPHSLFDFIS